MYANIHAKNRRRTDGAKYNYDFVPIIILQGGSLALGGSFTCNPEQVAWYIKHIDIYR